MDNKNLDVLISELNSNLDTFIDGNNSYFEFRDDVNKGDGAFSTSKVKIDRDVDIEWVDKIEDSIIALDTILRAPRNFIQDVEEIVPIEMSRKIGSESVKHLATHTNFIQSVEGDKVTPNKILNVYKEESYATYENRFIKTLLVHLEAFIEKRYIGLISQKDVNNRADAHVIEEFKIGDETVKYNMNLSISSPSLIIEAQSFKNPKQQSEENKDRANENSIERVERVRLIIHEFMTGTFMSLLKDAPLVKPPIQKTNLLTKNIEYKKALDLWQFIESYTARGFDVKLNEENRPPQKEHIERMIELSYIEYLYLKKYSGEDVDQTLKTALNKQLAYLNVDTTGLAVSRGGKGGSGAGVFGNGKNGLSINSRNLIKKEFAKMLGHYTDDLEEVKNIFTLEYERQNRAIKKEEKRLEDALRRIIERQKQLDIKEAKAAKERERKEKAHLIAQEKAKEAREKREQERKEKEALRLQRKAEREKIQEELRIKREIEQAEKARLRKEALKQAQEEKERKAIEKRNKALEKINTAQEGEGDNQSNSKVNISKFISKKKKTTTSKPKVSISSLLNKPEEEAVEAKDSVDNKEESKPSIMDMLNLVKKPIKKDDSKPLTKEESEEADAKAKIAALNKSIENKNKVNKAKTNIENTVTKARTKAQSKVKPNPISDKINEKIDLAILQNRKNRNKEIKEEKEKLAIAKTDLENLKKKQKNSEE